MSTGPLSTKVLPDGLTGASTKDKWTTPEGHTAEHISSNLIRVTLKPRSQP